MEDIKKLQKKLGITFSDLDLLEQAMVHRSYLNEHNNFHLDHNERLEFLGDAVLEIVVTDYLYRNFPNPEGELTSIRAALVNSDMLAKKSRELGLDEYLRLSHGEAKDTGRARTFILANTIEALIGAIYLDQAMEGASKFIHQYLIPEIKEIIQKELYRDPKSTFQEMAQERLHLTPNYKVLEESGPDHNKEFIVGIFLGEELVAKGNGSSKQIAQVEAAREGLVKKGW